MANKTTRTLYDGDVVIDFYPDSHRYKMVGEKTWLTSVTGITGIISKGDTLLNWAVKCACTLMREHVNANANTGFDATKLHELIDQAQKQWREVRDEAADIGKAVHDFAEQFALAKGTGSEIPKIPDGLDEKVLQGINAFLDWFNTHNVKFIAVEEMIYSKAHGYVGLFDAVAEVDGKLTLIDYKTSSGVYSDHFYQLSAYWQAWEEEHGKQIEQGMVLHFDKNTGAFTPHVMERSEYHKNLPVFLACLVVKEREKELARA